MPTITFDMADSAVDIVARDQTVTVDFAKIAPAVLGRIFTYGLLQKVRDSASSAAADAACAHFGWDSKEYAAQKAAKNPEIARYLNSDKGKQAADAMALAAMKDTVESVLYAGQWERERASGAGRPKADPVLTLARELAWNDLSATLTAVIGKDEKTWVKHPAAAKYFAVSDRGRVTIVKAELDAYMERAKSRAKSPVDFMAKARETLATTATAATEADLSDLGL